MNRRRTYWSRRLRDPGDPSGEDMRRWAKLVKVAAKAGADPAFPPGDVAIARNRCRGRLLPRDQRVAGSPLDRLCRLTDRWAVMLGTQRIAAMPELAAIAQECAPLVERPLPASQPQRERRSRADIDDRD